MNHSELLKRLSACREATEWYNGRDSKAAWAECERGDWMLWIAVRLGVDRKLIVLATCDCAETALKHIPSGEERTRIALETARAWTRGEATIEQVRAAADAAADAAAYAAAADTAAYAAADAAAYSAAAAAAAAADAAYAYAAAAAAAAYARRESLRNSAELVRKQIPWEVVAKALEGKP